MNGRNLYPNDIESVLEETPGIRRGCVAAFGIDDGIERIIAIAEVRAKEDFNTIYTTMRRNVASMYGVEIYEIVLIQVIYNSVYNIK